MLPEILGETTVTENEDGDFDLRVGTLQSGTAIFASFYSGRQIADALDAVKGTR